MDKKGFYTSKLSTVVIYFKPDINPDKIKFLDF